MATAKETIIGLIATFIVIGILSQPPTHACFEDETKAYCDHLSSTGRTCYPEPDTTKGKKLCSGIWKEIPKSEGQEEPVKVISYQPATEGRQHCSQENVKKFGRGCI